jgi:L-ascorbate metabolism protein UlaG (beta-lactamase superfamily)
MRIKWYCHATFLIEGDGRRIITDPYDPEAMHFQPIHEPAEIVIRSSGLDRGHNCAQMISGNPLIVTATGVPPRGVRIDDLLIEAMPTQESLVHKETPDDNAMYRFTVEGIRIGHMGDVGNMLTPEQVDFLKGLDLLFALTGGKPTIDLDDLDEVIRQTGPRVIIPMHYRVETARMSMLPVSAFTDRFPAEHIRWVDGSEIELGKETLPPEQQVIVLQPSTA